MNIKHGNRIIQYKMDKNKTDELRNMYLLLCELNQSVPQGVEVTAVKDLGANHGLAYQHTRQIVIATEAWKYEEGRRHVPKIGWVDAPPKQGYVLYVLCHELAHIARSDNGDFTTVHQVAFQRDLMDICPSELQHYEYEYMPDHAIQAGVEHRVDFVQS